MNPSDDYDPGRLFIGNPPWKGKPMQPVSEGPHTTEHPMGNAGDDFDTRERRLKAFAKKYRAKAKEFAEADIKGGLWLDDNGNFYSLLVPIDIDTTFVEISDIISALATDPDSPALNENPIHLSKREFAAITMRVPQSGIEWLDRMIEQANRREAAITIYAGYVNSPWAGQYPEMLRNFMSSGEAMEKADALLAALARDKEVE